MNVADILTKQGANQDAQTKVNHKKKASSQVIFIQEQYTETTGLLFVFCVFVCFVLAGLHSFNCSLSLWKHQDGEFPSQAGSQCQR